MKHAGKIGKIMACAGVVLGVYSVPPDARAEAVLYGANFCTAQTGDILFIRHTPFGIRNVSNRTATVECPFVYNLSNDRLNEVDVFAVDLNPTRDVVCTLRGFNSGGAQEFTDTKATTDVAFQIAFIFDPPMPFLFGTLNLTCQIPAVTSQGASGLITYRLFTTIH